MALMMAGEEGEIEMKKIRVCVLGQSHIAVKANTKRFGPHAIIYEGNTFAECFSWIESVTGRTVYGIEWKTSARYQDRTGLRLPAEMRVCLRSKRADDPPAGTVPPVVLKVAGPKGAQNVL